MVKYGLWLNESGEYENIELNASIIMKLYFDVTAVSHFDKELQITSDSSLRKNLVSSSWSMSF